MSIGSFDVELNGVKYNLAEDAEGSHYDLTGEPLRPPNAVTVQGEKQQTFQMRQDAMLWSLTDWSGGEGQIKFNAQTPNRWRELTGVRAFERPGTLQPGYYVEDTQITGGGGDLAIPGVLAEGDGLLYAMPHKDNDTIYVWDDTNEVWNTGTNLAMGGAGPTYQADGDGTHTYWVEDNAGDVWKYDGTTLTQIGDTFVLSSGAYPKSLGAYVYWYRPVSGQVYELAKSGADAAGKGTLIDDFSDDPSLAGLPDRPTHVMATLDGKLYVMVFMHNSTAIREITPTTAAGTGFGAEIARIPGFEGRSLTAHSGMLYITGREGSDNDRTVLYLSPGGEYGSLGHIRHGKQLGMLLSHHSGGRMLDHFFLTESGNGEGVHGLWQVDAVSGGMAMVAYVEDSDIDGIPIGPVTHNGDVFWSVENTATTDRVVRARQDQYTKSSEAISSWHDFGLANEKILSSLVLSTEKLPADWTVYVDYAVDGEDTWTNAITYNTTNGKGERVSVSTDSSTATFGTLSVRIRMEYTGAGIPSSAPVVLGVDANAMVNKPVKVWNLLLDLSDDRDRPGGFSGARKTTNVTSAGDSEKVVAFKDGYQSATPGVFDEHDVVIDTYRIILSTPGEGVAAVKLRETV